jgi:hypothetical protein
MATRQVLLPFDETQWIIRIRRLLDEEIELCEDQPISIFEVPKALLRTNPEAYMPQLVSLGPYHHSRDELCDMEIQALGSQESPSLSPRKGFSTACAQLYKYRTSHSCSLSQVGYRQ